MFARPVTYLLRIVSLSSLLLAACSVVKESPAVSSVTTDTVESSVAAARLDASKKLRVAEVLMRGRVFVIPSPHAPDPSQLVLLKFSMPEYEFVPVFSDRQTFDIEARGTGFEGKAISIDAASFVALLDDDDIVILNPGHRPAMEFKASELKKFVKPVPRP